jgi:hypothetical protein
MELFERDPGRPPIVLSGAGVCPLPIELSGRVGIFGFSNWPALSKREVRWAPSAKG